MKNWRNTTLENLTEIVNGVLRTEVWKNIEGYEGRYQVSDFGRVKSFVVSGHGRIRKGVPALGYPQVQLKGNGDGTMETKKIHRLVGVAFLSNPDNLPEINHLFGDRGDCRAWKIEWSTPSDNIKHAYRELGKRNNLECQIGEGHYNAKFKKQDILNIREMFASGKYTKKQIADIYVENSSNISRIITRQRWKHI